MDKTEVPKRLFDILKEIIAYAENEDIKSNHIWLLLGEASNLINGLKDKNEQ